MRTDLVAGELTLLQSGAYAEHWRLKVANGDGTLIDLSTLLKNGSVRLPDPDSPIGTAEVTLWREINDDASASLSPLVASSYNVLDDNVTPSPLIQIGRAATLELAVTAVGAARPADVSASWHEIIGGFVKQPSWPQRYGDISVEIHDRAYKLKRTFIESPSTTSSGTTIEATILAVLDDVMGSGAYPVTVDDVAGGGTTGSALSVNYLPDIVPVWDAIQALAKSIGWTLWYRYNGAGNAILTLTEPRRSKTVADYTFTTAQIADIEELTIIEEDIRNVVVVAYLDTDEADQSVTSEDATSIATYGGIRRYMKIAEGVDSPIRTQASAETLRDAALADLKDPDADQAIKTIGAWWPGESSVDLMAFDGNEFVYDSTQKLAPYAISIEFAQGTLSSATIRARGKPSAGSGSWRDRNKKRLPDTFTVVAPTGVTATSTAATSLVTQESHIIPRVLIGWTGSTDRFLRGYVVQSKLDTEADSAFKVVGRPAKGDVGFFITDVADGVIYDFRIAAVNTIGVLSGWVDAADHTVSTQATITVDVLSTSAKNLTPDSGSQVWQMIFNLYVGPGTNSVRVQYTHTQPNPSPPPTNFVAVIDYYVNVSGPGKITHILEDGLGAAKKWLAQDDSGTTIYDEASPVTFTPHKLAAAAGTAGEIVIVDTPDLSDVQTVGMMVLSGTGQELPADRPVFGEGLTVTRDGDGRPNIIVDIDPLTADATPDGAADYVMTRDATTGGLKKVLLDNLPSGAGDITEVVAGTGLTDGGTSGSVTLNVAGTTNRISVSANAVDISSGYVGQASITTLGTIAIGVWSATAIGETKGGTGQTAYVAGDILYASATNVLQRLAKGTNGQILKLVTGIPAWAAGGGTVTEVTTPVNSGLDIATGTTTPDITLSFDELSEHTGDLDGANRIVVTATNGAEAETISNISLDIFKALSLTNAAVSASAAIAVSKLAAGTFASGNYTFPGTLRVNGNVGIGAPASGETLNLKDTTGGQKVLQIEHSHATTPNGMQFFFSGGAPNDRTQYFIKCVDSGATRSALWSDGGATWQGNHDGPGLWQAGTVASDFGGTGLKNTNLTAGDLLTSIDGSSWAALSIGAAPDNSVLTIVAGAPDWATTAGDITAVEVDTGLSVANGTGPIPTVSLNLGALPDTQTPTGPDELVWLDAGVESTKAFSSVPLGIFSNDQGWTANAGDITRVNITAGTNLSGTQNTASGDHTQTISLAASISLTNVTISSDMRLKNPLGELSPEESLRAICVLRPVYYSRTDDPTAKREAGLYAQEVRNILPDAVTEDSDGYLGIDYTRTLVTHLIGAVSALRSRVRELEAA